MKKHILLCLGISLWALSTSAQNIYNTNGSLTSNRTVTMNNQSLTFAGSSKSVYITNNGNVGIGAYPVMKLEVSNPTYPANSNFHDHAFFGTIITTGSFPNLLDNRKGLLIQQKYLSTTTENVMRLQSVYETSRQGSHLEAGFMEFNPIVTSNSTRGAVNFGYNGTEFMRINQNGKVRIANGGSDILMPDGYRLFVEEGILTEKLKVALESTGDWSDYVFEPGYDLMPLSEVEQFTKENKHLPNVPSAKEMVEKGLDVAKMDAKLLEKIEELTLYLIEQQKQIESLKAELKTLKEQK